MASQFPVWPSRGGTESDPVPSNAGGARGSPLVSEPLTQLAAYFHGNIELPDRELAWLAAAARAGGSCWDDIAAACGIASYGDLAGRDYFLVGDTGAELLFSATQTAVMRLTG